METLSKIANSPVDFDCHGTNLKLYGLRLMDWGDVEQWMRSQLVDSAVQVIESRPSMDQDLRLDILQAAHAEGTKISIGQCFLTRQQVKEDIGKTMAFLRTFTGMLRVVHLALRDEPGENGKPLFKLKHVGDLFQNDTNALIEAFGAVVDHSFPTEEKTGEVKDEEKNQTETEQKS